MEFIEKVSSFKFYYYEIFKISENEFKCILYEKENQYIREIISDTIENGKNFYNELIYHLEKRRK